MAQSKQQKILKSKKIYLIRHGQSTWNAKYIIQGHSDPGLSGIGKAQAEKLAAYLSDISFDCLCTSPLKRALDTSKIIAKKANIPLNVYDDLKEIYLGDWEGKNPRDIDKLHNNSFSKWVRDPAKIKIPNAERPLLFQKRAAAIFTHILKKQKGKDKIVIVTHGGVIAAILAKIFNCDFRKTIFTLRLDNAGITEIDFFGDSFIVNSINKIAHLNSRARIDKTFSGTGGAGGS